MPITTIIDASFGDCGKAKVVDYFAKDSDIVARYCGSSNSGHTIVVDGEKYITRLIPSALLYRHVKLVIAQGVLLDIEVLLNEIKQFSKFDILSRLLVSDKCHVLFPYHKAADRENEKQTNSKIGSTKNGVAFCAQDKFGRRGIRAVDMLKDIYKTTDNIKENMKFWNINDTSVYDQSVNLMLEMLKYKEIFVDTCKYINQNLDKNIIAESAQGVFLDIENGYFPYVTSIPCTAAGAALGLNVSPRAIGQGNIVGLTKAYTTRVGNGDFKTELDGDIAETIRKNGDEYGSVTKRPRRVGWLNLDELRHAHMVNSFDSLFLTKIDVLNNLQTVCIFADDKYIKFDGWKSYEDENCKKYVKAIEDICKVPVSYISFGAERSQCAKR